MISDHLDCNTLVFLLSLPVDVYARVPAGSWSDLQMIKFISHRHKLQRFRFGLKSAACFKIFQVTVINVPQKHCYVVK